MNFELISSLQNPKIKQVQKLQEKPAERRKNRTMLVEGRKEIELALKAQIPIQTAFFCSELINKSDFWELFSGKKLPQNKIFEVTKPVFEKIAYRENSFGVVLLVEAPVFNLSHLKLSDNPLLLVLENVEKPGNLGAILRTADAAGIDAVLVCNPQTDLLNPNVVRSSLGCIFTTQVATCTNEEALVFLKQKSIQILATALTASVPYTQINFRKPTAILMGTEATGLSEFWLKNASQNIIIPMRGEIDSMNVSVAAAIVVFEALRQRS
ncbi:MAG: RNA methyltransferase [Raineya sp.]